MRHNYRLWTDLPYAGEDKPPANPEEPLSRLWPMYFFKVTSSGALIGPNGDTVIPDIQNPNTVDWNTELKVVQNTMNTMAEPIITIAKYWGTGIPSKQITPIVYRLIDTYGIAPSRAERILSALHAGIHDILVITWILKFRWLVARPNQLDPNLATVLCTPRHPTYPAGHSTIAGLTAAILSYFFPGEAERLHDMALECALSRLYAGVHFWIDNQEGLRLGKQIGRIVVDFLYSQDYLGDHPIDKPFNQSLHAVMQPPPYEQVLQFDYKSKCSSKLMTT